MARARRAVAAALAAGVSIAAVVSCGDRGALRPAGESPSAGPAAPPIAGRDWSAIRWPFHCSDVAVRTTQRVVADVTGDVVADAVVVAFCNAGAGNPPQHLLVLDGASPAGPPRVRAELRAPGVEFFQGVRVAAGVVRATGLGYSRMDVPRCCPDVRRPFSWRWTGSTFVRTPR